VAGLYWGRKREKRDGIFSWGHKKEVFSSVDPDEILETKKGEEGGAFKPFFDGAGRGGKGAVGVLLLRVGRAS